MPHIEAGKEFFQSNHVLPPYEYAVLPAIKAVVTARSEGSAVSLTRESLAVLAGSADGVIMTSFSISEGVTEHDRKYTCVMGGTPFNRLDR